MGLLLGALLIMASPLVPTTRGGTTIGDAVLMALLLAPTTGGTTSTTNGHLAGKGLVGWITRVASGFDSLQNVGEAFVALSMSPRLNYVSFLSQFGSI